MNVFLYTLCYLAVCLAATTIIEGVLMYLITKSWKKVYYSFLCNLATNPLLNFVMLFIINVFNVTVNTPWYLLIFALGETAVVFAECGIFKYLNVFEDKKCFKMSLLINLVSALCGFLVTVISEYYIVF